MLRYFLCWMASVSRVPKSLYQEQAVIDVFKQFDFYYPVKITVEETSPLKGFPWLRPSDFIRSMGRMNDISHLLGGHRSVAAAKPMLLQFWSKFRTLHPRHALWEQLSAGRKTLEQCIPLYVHGDEGVTYKKGGILILSFQPVIGFGCSKRAQEVANMYRSSTEQMPLNFLKTGMETRMLTLVCPKDWLDKND